MLWSFFLVGFLVSSIHGSDDLSLFKNCSQIPFCASLRHQTVDQPSQFLAELTGIIADRTNTLKLPLTNGKNESLILQLSLLEGRKMRVQIRDPTNERYELNEVLENEPRILSFNTMSAKNTSISWGVLDNGDNYNFVVHRGPPFTIEFFLEDKLEVFFTGDRLVMPSNSKIFSFGVEFHDASKLYGLGHHAHKLALSETAYDSTDPFRLRNSDTAHYLPDSPMALYGSIPVIYGHSKNVTSGIFLHNAAELWVDINYRGSRPSAYFMAGGGSLDLFVLLGPTPTEVVRQFTDLTGVAHMPQLWTLGYHQCRFTYWTQEEVKDVVALMDIHDFPLDAIWLDDGHSDANRYFRWNPVNFSDPIGLQKNISATGRVMVSISDPHIKVDSNYSVYTGAQHLFFVKWANGSNFEGDCWPGLSSWIDFFNPIASDYYAGWYAFDKFNGSTETLAGIWNDMNEPSVFDDDLEKTFPFELVHNGYIRHSDVHNLYGFMQTKATHQGLMVRDNGLKRPFILTRSHFAGSQRYAAIWTGDNTADWPYLAASYSECLTANLLGMVFCGADIGGFFGNPSEQLIQRWYQAAIWLPFFRGHSNKGTERREPYVYNAEVQITIRASFKLRYKHIPVWYTLFYEHTRYGDPVIRPLFYHYPELLEYDDHLLLGSDILVTPVMLEDVSQVNVTFPGDETTYWYRIDDETWTFYTGGSKQTIDAPLTQWSAAPYFYRGGSIISRKDLEKSSTSKMLNDPFTLYINVNSEGGAAGRLYIDDYTSFEYLHHSRYLYIQLIYIPLTQGVHFNIIDGDAEGINMSIHAIVVHERSTSDDEIVKKEYTTTSDGTPLNNINFVGKLNARTNGFTLYL